VPAVALLAAGPDAVTTGGTALGLGGRESAQRQLEVRLGRVTVAGEDGDLVGAPGLQPQGKGGCIGRVPHAAVAGGLAGQAVAGPHGVEGHLGERITRGRGAVAGDEVAEIGAGRQRITRQVDLAALLRRRISVGIDVHLAGKTLVHTAQVDDQDAIDEHERVVVAVELQVEGTVEGEQVADLGGEPRVVEPALHRVDPVSARMGGERHAGREQILVALAARATAEHRGAVAVRAVPVGPQIAQQLLSGRHHVRRPGPSRGPVHRPSRAVVREARGGVHTRQLSRRIVEGEHVRRRIEREEAAEDAVLGARELVVAGVPRQRSRRQLEDADRVLAGAGTVALPGPVRPPLTERRGAGHDRRAAVVHRVARGAGGIRQPVRRTVGGLGIARHVAAVGVVAEVGELAISHRGDVVATRALGVEGRLAGAVEVRRGDVPGARGRVVLARRTTRVRHAVALGEGRRGGLPLHASDRLVAGVGRRPGRPQVEEVVVPAGEALVLEVAVLDRQLEALPAVPVLHAVGGIGQGNVLAIEARLLGAGARAAVAVDLVAVVAVLARLDVAVPAARRAGRRRARAAGGARPRARATGRLLGTGLRAPGAVAVEETVGPGAAARQGRRVSAAVAGLAGLFDAVAALRDGAGAGHGRRHRARTGGAWLPLTARRA